MSLCSDSVGVKSVYCHLMALDSFHLILKDRILNEKDGGEMSGHSHGVRRGCSSVESEWRLMIIND